MSFTSARARRDLTIAVGSRAISLLGDEAAVVALTLRLQSSGASAWSIVALLSAGLLPLVLLAPIAGRVVDRVDSRTLLVGSGLAQALLCLLLAQAGDTGVILVLVLALGAGQAISGATSQALLPAIVGDEQLPRALGLSQAAGTIASVAAPALAGVLTGRFGSSVPILVDAGSFVVVAIGGLLVRTRRVHVASDTDERGGFALLRADPVLALVIGLLALFIVLGAAVNVVDVFLVRDTLHASSTWYGAVAALWGIGLVGGSLLAGRLRGQVQLARALVGCAGVLALALSGYALAANAGWLVPAALIGGAANGVLNLSSGALLMTRAPAVARGRISAAVNGITSAALIGAFVIGGALATVLTPREIFALAAVTGLLAPAIFGAALLRAVRQPVQTAATVDG